jgi:hypothetical protein
VQTTSENDIHDRGFVAGSAQAPEPTNAGATVMKMGDEGFRPAYNGQFASDTGSQVVVGVDAVTVGTDRPVGSRRRAHRGLRPGAQAERPRHRSALCKDGDNEAVGAWRQRMGMDGTKAIEKDRVTTAECVNAQTRERGLTPLQVRGTAKVRCVCYYMPSRTT